MSTLADNEAWVADKVNVLIQELEQHIRLLDVIVQEGLVSDRDNAKDRLKRQANRLRRMAYEVEEQRK